jgi:LmbE family N-acetylglucosaminyl deacetylase
VSDISLFEGKRCLILLPHYDDEIFCLPLISRLFEAGISLQILWLTNSQGMNIKIGQKTITKRMKESEIFIRKITNNHVKITHIGVNRSIADGYLIYHLREIFDFLKSEMNNTKATFLTPLWENGHADHDASFILGKILEENGNGKHVSFPIYDTKTAWLPFRVMHLKKNEKDLYVKIKRKDKFIAIMAPYFFRSQIKSWIGLYLPMLTKFIFSNRFFFIEGNKYQELKIGNSRLVRRRAKSDYEKIVNQIKTYSQENGIDIN